MKIYNIGIWFGYMTLFQTVVISKCEPGELMDKLTNMWTSISNVLKLVENWLTDSKELKIFLLIYSREFNIPMKLDLPAKDASLIRGKIPNEKQLVLIIHGFITGSEAQWTKDLTQVYLKQRDVTIGVVDWSSGSKTIDYFDAIDRVPKVAEQLISFIEYLIKEFDFKPRNIHIIGHSLGAHIAGNVGRGIPFIHRITGLDPAALFRHRPSATELRNTDAELVDVLHTNTILGDTELFGTVDFYINDCRGTGIQPTCNPVKTYDLIKKINYNDCSHHIVILYLIESINNPTCLFVASETKERANKITSSDFDPKRDSVLGLDTFKYDARGKLYISTNKHPPYCRNASLESACG